MDWLELRQTADAANAYADTMLRLIDRGKEPNVLQHDAMRLKVEAAKLDALLLIEQNLNELRRRRTSFGG